MKKITLDKFLKDNEQQLIVLGIFLAILPFSFDTIKKLSLDYPDILTYSGILSIATSVIILLILKNMVWKEDQEYSFDTIIFMVSIVVISGTISFLTYRIYTSMTLSFLKFVLQGSYFIMGIIVAVKFFEWINKTKKFIFLRNLFLLILAFTLVLADFKFFTDLLTKINFTIPSLLTIGHETIFFQGMGLIILVYGFFGSGIGYFGQEILYKKFLKKDVKITEDYILSFMEN